MHFWNETDAKRGVDEVGSVLLKHIRSTLNPLQAGEERCLVVWSDRCRGQACNFPFFCTMMYLMSTGYFTKVELKFLFTGHSFSECDRCFASIEAKKKRATVFTPDDWCEVIGTARPRKPFQVIRMTQDDVVGVKDAFKNFRRPPTLKITEVMWLTAEKNNPARLTSKSSHELNEQWSLHVMLSSLRQVLSVPRREIQNEEISAVPLRRKYHQPIRLSAEKKKDLEALLPFLDPIHRIFFLNLFDEPQV